MSFYAAVLDAVTLARHPLLDSGKHDPCELVHRSTANESPILDQVSHSPVEEPREACVSLVATPALNVPFVIGGRPTSIGHGARGRPCWQNKFDRVRHAQC